MNAHPAPVRRILFATVLSISITGSAMPAGVPPSAVATQPSGTALPPDTPLTRDLLLSKLGRELAGHFDLEGDLRLELIRDWTPPARLAGAWTIEILEYPTVPSSSMLVRCRVIADSTVVAEPTLVVRAVLWRDAWVARMPLTYGAVFDRTVLEPRRVDILRERNALPAAVGDASFIFSCSVPAGTLLTWRDVAKRPLVKKGEIVDVAAIDGMLTVTMKGVAMESGGKGDMVTIRNPDSLKDFSATVVDENRVQVSF